MNNLIKIKLIIFYLMVIYYSIPIGGLWKVILKDETIMEKSIKLITYYISM